ncbi:MAG: hypothetical protein K9M44_02035 [Candidatus Pacebacteria bacterium]|nr:hypothetical protein [Candidatus Paceibacterota bacterium]
MKTNFKNYKQLVSVLSLAVAGVFLLANPASADFGSWAANIFASLLAVIINGIAWIISLIIQVFIDLAQYNGFTTAPAVTRGWEVVRDVGNMFFILIFLLIAFATILRIEAYNYKKHLPKLILMAILINFSKTICALFIDFSQVIMLTFVNGFKSIGEGSLVHMLGLKEIFNLQEQAGDVNFWSIAGAYLLGLLYVIIALVVVAAMTVFLIMRIVMLWIYVILSPFAFLLAAFPGGQSYSQQWWSKFSKELIAGPVLAFFVWLAFVSATFTSSGYEVLHGSGAEIPADYKEKAETSAAISEAGTKDVFLRFIVSIGMLIGGLMITQQIGGSGGQMAGKAIGALQSGQRSITNAGKRRLQKIGKSAKYLKDKAVAKGSEWTGLELSSSQRAANKKARRESSLASSRVAANKSIAERAEKGGFMGNLALASSGHKSGLQMLRFGQAVRTKKAHRAKQEIANTQERIAQIEDQRATHTSRQQRVSQLEATEKQAGTRISQIDTDIDREVVAGNINGDRYNQLVQEKAQQTSVQQNAETERQALEQEIRNNRPDPNLDRELSGLQARQEVAETELQQAQSGSIINMGSQRRSAQAEQDRKASETIAHIDNSSELVQAIRDGLRSGNQAQVRVASKKLAKNGDYNQLNKALNLGSGQEGMLGLANILQSQGNFNKQDSLSLVSEIGDLAKNNGQLAPYGVATMENGVWRESSKTEKQAAVYSNLAGRSMEDVVRKLGVSSLGSYQGGGDSSPDNWRLDSAAVVALRPNEDQLINALGRYGNQEMISHLNTTANIKILQDNGMGKLVAEIQRLSGQLGSGSDNNIEDLIRNIVINP